MKSSGRISFGRGSREIQQPDNLKGIGDWVLGIGYWENSLPVLSH
ncbi:hypothetical protein [Anabaena sp. CA = ATCC 33047]|nr:hypothetical protein [Anabaena sp. CA = ATCC 33047]